MKYNMKLKPLIYTILILCSLAFPVMAAGGNFTMPTFSAAWGGLDSGIRDKIMWVIGIAFIVLVISAILGATFGGAKATLATVTGNVGGRSEGISSVLIVIGVVFLATVVIGFVLWIAG